MEKEGKQPYSPKRKPSVARRVVAFFLLSLIAFWLFLEIIVEYDARYQPDYEQASLERVLEEGEGDDLYRQLLQQTGLGEAAAREILSSGKKDPLQVLQGYQKDFFSEKTILCRKITPITGEEKNGDEEGNPAPGFQIAGTRTGDIFLSFSTHSLGWRHGHSALVTNGDTGRTLEAVVLGSNSEAQQSDKWTKYPTFLQLRLSDEALELLGISREEAENQLKALGEDKLTDIPYGLLTGLFGKYVPDIRETQCAHLVWFAFYELGLDIDSDGGWLVTPRDIAGSPYFDVVQIYGMDPEAVNNKESLEGTEEKE